MRCATSRLWVLALLSLLLGSFTGCRSETSGGALTCVNDIDCPPQCMCEKTFPVDVQGTCERDGAGCAGSCVSSTSCPQGSQCFLDGFNGSVERYACKQPGTDGFGEPCLSNAECNPDASELGAYCCLDSDKCGGNFEQCVEDCSTFSSGGLVGTAEGALCVDNSECAESLFCCLVPDAAGNCDFEQDESCTCRGTSDPVDCQGELIVETMTNNVSCVAPDVSACSGCNAYCLGNGFPFGSTGEACGAGLCRCDCTYCLVD